ncbi:MAG: SulP family inorganic anion transporter [Altererythrobacter sp.]|nr:SulP family inorganic anion transporter [Altererythrobacter sp.]
MPCRYVDSKCRCRTVCRTVSSALKSRFWLGSRSLLSAIVADRMIGGAHRSNAELIAQGAANIASPLFGGLPATSAITRTATNVNAGRRAVAGIVHMVVLLALLVAAPLAGALALPALAALLIVTAWTMSEAALARTVVSAQRRTALLFGTAASHGASHRPYRRHRGRDDDRIGAQTVARRDQAHAGTPFRWGGDKPTIDLQPIRPTFRGRIEGQ